MRKPSRDSRLHESKCLTIDDFEYLCFNLTRDFFSFHEPIPDYETRDSALLESALGSPRQTFGGKLLYPTLVKQASILFYSLIKNHPFKNGNKRIAVMSLLAFLSLNSKWISVDPVLLYKLAYEVSESDPRKKDFVLNRIEDFIGKNIIGLLIKAK